MTGPVRSSFPDSVIERGICAVKTKTEREDGPPFYRHPASSEPEFLVLKTIEGCKNLATLSLSMNDKFYFKP
jgi:hypothetical protein